MDRSIDTDDKLNSEGMIAPKSKPIYEVGAVSDVGLAAIPEAGMIDAMTKMNIRLFIPGNLRSHWRSQAGEHERKPHAESSQAASFPQPPNSARTFEWPKSQVFSDFLEYRGLII